MIPEPSTIPFESHFRRPASLAMPDPSKDGYRLEIDIPIPMRDGTRLATDLYFPVEPGARPVLLERTPYGKHESVMVSIGAPGFLARNGYVVAVQDARGRFASEGRWYPFLDEAWGENRDGYDTIEWLAAQPFSTGKVGTFGGSFAGFNQYTLAGAMPPHLGATFPRQAPCNLRTEWVYRGGALEFAFIVAGWGRKNSEETLRNRTRQYLGKSGKVQLDLESGWPLPIHPLLSDPFQWIRDYVDRQDDEKYWQQWDIAPHHAAFDRPSYHVASWFDIFLGGSLRNYIGMRSKARSEAVRKAHKLIVGPWAHGPFFDRAPQGRRAGEADFGEAALWDYTGTMCRWFDNWLKGQNNGIADEPDVRYFMMGLNEWRSADDWPPPAARRRLYFANERSGSAVSLNDGALAWEPASGAQQPAGYLHDPDRPAPSSGGTTLFSVMTREGERVATWDDFNAQAGSQDQRRIEGDCLTYTSAPFDNDFEIAGPVTAMLYMSSSAVDADLVVRLCDVHPDGRSMLLCDGIQRARYRDSNYKPSLLQPGEIYAITVDLWSTANVFRAGHRIRVIVNSSCFPRFDVNPGTGRSALSSTERVKAEIRIYADERRPSHILLPCIANRP